jgi:hypothetical protein
VGYVILRVAMLLAVAVAALKAYRAGRTLPLLLVGAGGLDLATGQFGQPTTLGFAVFTAGLALTAASEETVSTPTPSSPAPPSTASIRGRSPYAVRLHGDGMRSELR